MNFLYLRVVIDLGTGFLKAGLSTNPIPDFVLPNSVVHPIIQSDESFARAKLKDVMICDEITPVHQYLDLTFPVEHDVIKNWDDETLVLDYLFKQKFKLEDNSEYLLQKLH